MSSTLMTVFITSLLGSSHCAGMCGPFLILASGKDQGPQTRVTSLMLDYHLGRLASYCLLGLLAGLLGYGILGLGSLVGLAEWIMPLSGGMLILYGLVMFACSWLKKETFLASSPAFLARWIKQGYRRSMHLSPTFRAVSIGFYSGFLPCGWLYAFLLMAMGTGTLFDALGVILTFWLGTLPALVGLSFGMGRLSSWLHWRKSELSAAACVVFGILLLAMPRPCCSVSPTEPAASTQQDAITNRGCCHQ